MNNLWSNDIKKGVDPASTQKGRREKPVAPRAAGASIYRWDTNLPDSLCDEITNYYLNNKDIVAVPGRSAGDNKELKKGQRKARSVDARWSLPHDWVAGFMANYVSVANDMMFQYDIRALMFSEVHHLTYLPGHYYDWHTDQSPEQCSMYHPITWTAVHQNVTEYVRKISFTLQLSHPDDYTGGDLQIMNDASLQQMYVCSKERGSLVMFDSRLRHRIKPIKSGTRYCLVGWALGPRWK